MTCQQFELNISTSGRGAIDISSKIQAAVSQSMLQTGLVHVFLKHTSASLMLCENADSTVLDDLEMILQRLAPDGDPEYRHNYEGDDDMAAHVRSVLTTNELSLPIQAGRLALGTWQGVFLYEHRYRPHQRKILLTIQGER
jgi:secondary thiamine-phosphate synthase enzyme